MQKMFLNKDIPQKMSIKARKIYTAYGSKRQKQMIVTPTPNYVSNKRKVVTRQTNYRKKSKTPTQFLSNQQFFQIKSKLKKIYFNVDGQKRNTERRKILKTSQSKFGRGETRTQSQGRVKYDKKMMDFLETLQLNQDLKLQTQLKQSYHKKSKSRAAIYNNFSNN